MTKSLHKISMVDNEPEPDEVGRTSEGASHLRRYPAYKDSGVPWLGEIPAHWEVKRLKYLTDINAQALPENTDSGYRFDYIDIGSVGTGFLAAKPKRMRFGDAPSRARRLLKYGDTIISTVRTYLKAIYYVSAEVEDLVASTGFAVLTPRSGIVPECLSYVLQSEPFINRVCADSVGIAYPAIAESRLGSFAIAFPPPDEQRAIARFLDAYDRLTRRYINAQRRLIALLTEQKQALIQQAVTRGLNPDAPLKDSGVEWLGEIPAHWEVVRSRRLFSIRKEFARPDDIQLSATQAYGVIPQAEFEEKVGRRVVKIFMHLEKRRHVEKDDFVISMRSFQGGLERAWTSGAIRSSYVVLKPELSIDVDFFTYLFKSHDYIRALQATADFIRDGQDLTYENFCCVDLPLMPIDEQTAIADFISRATAGIDRGISRFSRQIDLVREYRTRLIADVVTGKLDVRGVALPEVPGEEADFDAGEDLSEDPDGDPTEDDVKID